MIKLCNYCKNNNEKKLGCTHGYYWLLLDSVDRCPVCENKLVNIDFDANDFKTIIKISTDESFIQAMIDLKEKDIIEYNLKMSQFKAQLSQTQAREESGKPHCPHCKSTNISPIGTGERVGSIAMWGVFSKKINKSFKCLDCKYTW